MATYQFSALASGQAISFNPNNDVLNFDQTQWAAARVRFVSEGANVRIITEAFSGPTDVVLLNVSPQQFTTGNITFADGSRLLHGDNSTALNDDAANTLNGTAGRDQLNGFGGADTMTGGLGDDVYFVTAGDVLSDTGGRDTIVTEISWALGGGFEEAEIAGSGAVNIEGNDLANRIVGNDAANRINARGGSDTLEGRGGNDYFNMSMGSTTSFGNDFIVGGEGRDTVDFGGNARSALTADLAQAFVHGGEANGGGASTILEIEDFIAGQFDDHVTGNDAANFLFGWRGNDTLIGAAGNDRLEGADGNDLLHGGAGSDFLIGGAGADIHLFAEAPASGNADSISGFASGSDRIWLDDAWHEGIGARGSFAAGDARFWAAAGATQGHDATDRVVYNTSNGNLYYDADGSGAGAAVLIATLGGAPALTATDIVAMGSGAGVIAGTEGDDSLTGTDGNDRIEGRGGDDTLAGLDGNDHLLGGDGNDRLDGGGHDDLVEGGAGNDELFAGWGLDRLEGGEGNDTLHAGGEGSTMVGGLGDDTYHTHGFFSSDQDDFTLIDEGGVDTIVTSHTWVLEDGFENLTLFGGIGESNAGWGNSADNLIISDTTSFDWITAFGGAGNDTLLGAQGNDYLYGEAGDDWLEWGSDFQEHNLLNGGAGSDRFVLRQTVDPSDILDDQIEDFASGTDRLLFDNDAASFGQLGAAGDFSAGDQRFHASADGAAHDASDRIIYDTDSGVLWYDADGSGAGAAVEIARLTGAPTVAASDITVIGESGGGGGGEEINGTEGNDSLVGTSGDDTINGLGGHDTLQGVNGGDLLDGGDGNDSIVGGGGEENMASDTLIGGAGNDTLNASVNWRFSTEDVLDGGLGDDTFIVDLEADVLTDAGGIDTVEAWEINWTLGDGFENLNLMSLEGGGIGIGNALNNVISGFRLSSLQGLSGNDTLSGQLMDGGEGNDVLDGFVGDDNDFLFTVAAGNANADQITNWESGLDRLRLDGTAMSQLGPNGNFDAHDARFWASASGAAHDADDRVLYNTTTRQLFYDADGNGSGAAQLIVTLQAGAVLAATDIWVDNGIPGEHVEGSLGNDSLVGTAGDDTIESFAGNDTLQGLGGHDLMAGDEGNDLLEGGAGRDTLNGGSGENTLSGGAGSDLIFAGNEGGDVVAFDVAPGAANVDEVSGFQTGADSLLFDLDVFGALGAAGRFSAGDGRFHAAANAVSGHDADDRIVYNLSSGDLYYDADGSGSGAAVLVANLRGFPVNTPSDLAAMDIVVEEDSAAGGQVINGTAGNDSLTGGDGDDTINGLAGDDTIDGGKGADRLDGGAGNDSLFGGPNDPESDAADVYIGGDGNDTLDGDSARHGEIDANAETMDGGLGNDLYIVDNAGDVLSDPGGIDTVEARNISWTLGAGFENLVINNGEAETVMRGTGNALNNVLDGSAFGWGVHLEGLAGSDTLLGSSRDDTLDGGAGVDTMIGGDRHDTYIVTAGDVLSEAADSGIDTVMSSISWGLGANFENLTLTGTAAITANGNNLDNVLTGNDANNSSINGRAGNDTMLGMGGNDTFDMSTGGTSTYGTDVIDGGAGTDTVDFGANARTAVNVNLGAGTMSGGGDGGTGSATLTSIENAVGGNFNDVLAGNAAANFFFGGNGNDTLTGGSGNDRLQGGAGNDAFVFNAAPGSANSDVVVDFATGADKLQMENAVMTAIGATGNFAAGDARFWAAAGATSGHDANDRIIYNTSTGSVYYDADGSGGGAAQLIATLQGQPALAATDIAVI